MSATSWSRLRAKTGLCSPVEESWKRVLSDVGGPSKAWPAWCGIQPGPTALQQWPALLLVSSISLADERMHTSCWAISPQVVFATSRRRNSISLCVGNGQAYDGQEQNEVQNGKTNERRSLQVEWSPSGATRAGIERSVGRVSGYRGVPVVRFLCFVVCRGLVGGGRRHQLLELVARSMLRRSSHG